jgi:DNA-binding response OmpR family regulator
LAATRHYYQVPELRAISPARIMIVEDEGLIAHYLSSLLTKAGYVVPGIAASGEELLDAMHQWSPDLILMDIHIDGPMDGIQTAAKLRENFEVPVVFLSAHSDNQTKARAKAIGASDFLKKPVNQGNLLNAIDVNLRKHRAANG